MTITDLVAPEAILPALKVNSKKQALQELAARAASLTGQNERAVFEVLLQREKLGTTAVGYGVGRYREVRDPSHGLLPIPVGAAATAGYVIGFAALSFMLEVRGPVSASVVREMLITILLNALLALLIFPLIRRFMGSALIGDLRERRRPRTATTGPLGLRGLEI